jgi:hypothetical protein
MIVLIVRSSLCYDSRESAFQDDLLLAVQIIFAATFIRMLYQIEGVAGPKLFDALAGIALRKFYLEK